MDEFERIFGSKSTKDGNVKNIEGYLEIILDEERKNNEMKLSFFKNKK